jgi:hypothetical protein
MELASGEPASSSNTASTPLSYRIVDDTHCVVMWVRAGPEDTTTTLGHTRRALQTASKHSMTVLAPAGQGCGWQSAGDAAGVTRRLLDC